MKTSIPSPAPLIQKTQPMAGFLLFWEWKSVAPISGLTSYNEKARFSLAQRPALRRSAAHLWARVTTTFGNFHPPNWRWEVAPGCHSVPEFVEVGRQVIE